MRVAPRDRLARQNEYATSLAVPTVTTKFAIADYVRPATAGLFALFDGASFESKEVVDILSVTEDRRVKPKRVNTSYTGTLTAAQ
jgi:hypothetical protein